MTSWQVLQFSGSGSFDYGANTREAVLIFILSRSEEGIACSILCEGALFFAETLLRAAVSMFSRTSSLATIAERR